MTTLILRDNLTSQILSLLLNDHKSESPQGHWKFVWSLTSRLVGLVKVHAS